MKSKDLTMDSDYVAWINSLKSKYDKYEPNSLNLKSSFELSFDSNTNNYSAQDIEQFIFYKYHFLFALFVKRCFELCTFIHEIDSILSYFS